MRFAILLFSAQNGPKLGQSSAGAGKLGLVKKKCMPYCVLLRAFVGRRIKMKQELI